MRKIIIVTLTAGLLFGSIGLAGPSGPGRGYCGVTTQS